MRSFIFRLLTTAPNDVIINLYKIIQTAGERNGEACAIEENIQI